MRRKLCNFALFCARIGEIERISRGLYRGTKAPEMKKYPDSIGLLSKIQPHAIPMVKVVRMRNHALGKTMINIDGTFVPIFDKEWTILDAFNYLSKETTVKALKIVLQEPTGKKSISIN